MRRFAAMPGRFLDRFGFSQRILMIALGGFLISTLLISLIILQLLKDQSHQVVLQQQQQIGQMVVRRIDNSIRERKEILEDFARQLSRQEALLPLEEIQQRLDQGVGLHRFYNGGMVVLDAAGHSIVDSPVVKGRVGIDFSDRPHVRKARSTKTTVITRPLIGRGLQSPVFVVDVPIVSQRGAVLGFIFGVTRLADTNLFQELGHESLGYEAQLMVVEPNLKLYVTATDPSLAMQSLPPPGEDAVLDRVLAGESSGYFTREDGGLILFSASRLEVMDWLVIHALPQPALYDSLRKSLIKLGLLIAGFTLIIGLLSGLLLRRQLRRLRETSSQINAMALGLKPYQQLQVDQQDEVGRLITAFNRLQQELQGHIQELERGNREMARLSEIMAHHFQEPARRLLSFAQRLQQRSSMIQDEDSRISLEFIQQQASRLSALTRDAQRYLALNKDRIKRTEISDAEAVLDQALALQRTKQQEFVLTRTGPLPKVRLPVVLLGELFVLLLDNAWRYRDSERPLQVEIGVEIDRSRGRARFRFADNGSGIAQEYREQALGLFTRLVPNSIPGTGMGLALAHKMVHLAGGHLSLEDGLQGGVAVVFDLPIESTE